MRERRAPLFPACVLLLLSSNLLIAATGNGPDKATSANRGEEELKVLARLGPDVRLVVAEHTWPLEILDPYFDHSSSQLEFTLRNLSETAVTAWSVETAVEGPGIEKPFVSRDLRDFFPEADRWLSPGESLSVKLPVQIVDRSKKQRKLLVTVRVDTVIFESTEYVGRPDTAARIFSERGAIERFNAQWLSRVKAIWSPSSSSSDSATAVEQLGEMARQEMAEPSLLATHRLRENLAWQIFQSSSATLEAPESERPGPAHRWLERLTQELDDVSTLARLHTPSAFLEPVKKMKPEGTGLLAKSQSGEACLSSSRFATEVINGSIKTATEEWHHICVLVSLEKVDTLTATGIKLGAPYIGWCGPEFTGDGAGSSYPTSPNQPVGWARGAWKGVDNAEAGCGRDLVKTSVVECDCPSSGGSEPPPEGEPSPIVIDLRRNGFDLTGSENPVSFDIDADGEQETISWTAATSDDAFLALDRNGNGTIDSGSELFGNHTPQPPHEAPNGFLALAVFDSNEEGGDGDGWITASDPIFYDLLLWTDRDHDGLSQSSEIRTLSNSAIVAIGLRYIKTRRVDEHGNEFRWASMVEFRDRQRKLAAVDFIFQTALPQ